MFTSKSGKKFGSSFAGRKHDEMHTADGLHKMGEDHEEKETPEFEAGEHEGAAEGKDEQPNEEQPMDENEQHPVAAEHGPAHKVVITHDEKSGRHTVTSHHKDGHMHTEAHDDAQKAHTAGKRLASVPDVDEEHSAMAAKSAPPEESDGFAMPSL